MRVCVGICAALVAAPTYAETNFGSDVSISEFHSVRPVAKDPANPAANVVSRSSSNRPEEIYNVLDYGARPDGCADFSDGFAKMVTLIGNGNATIYFPPGRYKFSRSFYVRQTTSIKTGMGVTFVDHVPNTLADPAVMQGLPLQVPEASPARCSNADMPATVRHPEATALSGGQAAASLQRLSTAPYNNWTSYLSLVSNSDSNAKVSWEKGALYADAVNHEESQYERDSIRHPAYDVVPYFRDTVGADLRAKIAEGNMKGRVWGAVLAAAGGPKTDGHMQGLEVDIVNNSIAQPQSEYNRFNNKVGIGIYNLGSNKATSGVLVSSEKQSFYDGVTVSASAVSRSAFQVIDLRSYPAQVPFKVDNAGNVSARSLVLTSFRYSGLPAADTPGREVFCSDCRKPGEASGAGTGMVVFDDGNGLKRWFTMAGTMASN